MTASLMDQTMFTNSEFSGAGAAPANWALLANEDMRVYLQELITHERVCAGETCRFCQSARNVYELVRSLIFSEVVYPDVTVAAHGPLTEAVAGAVRASAVAA